MISGSAPIGRLLFRQSARSEALDIGNRLYDLVLTAISWESRCTYAICNLHKRFASISAIRFQTTDRETDSRKSKFLAELQSITDQLDEIQLGTSTEYAENFRILDDIFAGKALERGRPLRVLCDITCIPKSYILFLLGLGFEKGYFARFDCLYSEGDYNAVYKPPVTKSTGGAEQGPISEGAWDTLSIPFFEPTAPIPKSRDLVVTVGGEVGLTVPFIEKYEPVRLGVICLSGGNIGDQDSLREILSEPNVVQSQIDVCDAVQVAQNAVGFAEESREEVVTALAVGSKPHALGLGVASLARQTIEVICRIPKRYTMLDVPPSKTVMFYQIEDRFEPHAYLVPEGEDKI